jgi:nitroreductase
MNSTAQQEISEVMKERQSTRKYKRGEKIPQATLTNILELATTAPSSWNLQHWKFIVVEKQENKDKLLPIAYNQQQVSDCSAVIVVLGDVQANKNSDKVHSEAVRAGNMTEDAKNSLVSNINNAYENVPNIGVHEAIRNASLAAMQLMVAAKANGVDSGPMGGYDAEAIRNELNIPDRYMPVMLITLGYASEPAHNTSRLQLNETVVKETF